MAPTWKRQFHLRNGQPEKVAARVVEAEVAVATVAVGAVVDQTSVRIKLVGLKVAPAVTARRNRQDGAGHDARTNPKKARVLVNQAVLGAPVRRRAHANEITAEGAEAAGVEAARTRGQAAAGAAHPQQVKIKLVLVYVENKKSFFVVLSG